MRFFRVMPINLVEEPECLSAVLAPSYHTQSERSLANFSHPRTWERARRKPTGYATGTAISFADPSLGVLALEVFDVDPHGCGQDSVLVQHVPAEIVDKWVVPKCPGRDSQDLRVVVFGHSSDGDGHVILEAPRLRPV